MPTIVPTLGRRTGQITSCFSTIRRLCRLALPVLLLLLAATPVQSAGDSLEAAFRQPPDSARPWVYWFWKNGNITREGISADLEAMERVGIGGVILMEVALVTPAGPVTFFSDGWRELFAHAVAEASRLGLKISVNSGPGWTGSGGPWVPASQSMQKVVASETTVNGPRRFQDVLPQPETLCDFYEDIAVLAFPASEGSDRIADIGEKALYQRGPYSSMPGVRPAFPARADYGSVPREGCVRLDALLNLTAKLAPTGRLDWEVPAGQWTIVRFGRTSTGQTNRPAPLLGLECDKLDKGPLEAHFHHFTTQLLKDVGSEHRKAVVATHLDSWEVGGQNWSRRFREEFLSRRGYDPIPYLPAMLGRIVESPELSERFLWDLRQTVSELIVENHGRHMRELARQQGLSLSIEPYDMTPCDDMTLGATADVPMCEFWTNTFDTRYSLKEATSVGHVYEKPIVAAEAFTSTESWLFHPATMKPYGDWAFCEGVNRFVIHRYVHQPFLQIRPGLTLGPHGIHYERTQTWWELTPPWHQYLARCQHLLQQGQPVSDILYLSPEGAPNVFQRPDPEPVGYKYDACTPEALLERVSVKDGRLVLPGGGSYTLLVLPAAQSMTPKLLAKVSQLVVAGATVVGNPPRKSPSLSGYPECDAQIQQLASTIWGAATAPPDIVRRPVGQGAVYWGGELTVPSSEEASENPITRARWIWGGSGNPAASAPVGKRYFRRILELDAELRSARLWMTADNAFELHVNGCVVASGDNFHQLALTDLTSLLKKGTNVLAIVADNGGQAANPAGLIGSLEIVDHAGQKRYLHTDAQWLTADRPTDDWISAAEPGPQWTPAVELGPATMAPWGTPRAAQRFPDIYPPSPAIARLLDQLGLQTDFDSDTPLRFVHRRLDAADVYFVSNGEAARVEAQCVFRVSGGKPELWHPETGEMRTLSSYSSTDGGRTLVPLRFEGYESYFIIFREPAAVSVAARERSGKKNFPDCLIAAELSGPWQVTFAPESGGPAESLAFDSLTDWTSRSEDAVRYYSGTAVYRKTFAYQPPADGEASRRRLLDLGQVHEFAQVRLNGQDAGYFLEASVPLRCNESTAARAK